MFVARAGQFGLAVAVLGLGAACGSDSPPDQGRPATTPDPPAGTTPPDDAAAATAAPTSDGAVAWHRVNLGFVSAYVLLRDGEAAVVDTGVEGSADDVEAVLTGAGADWSAVGHFVLTHKHPDHVGSLDAVAERASAAELYAGPGDIDAIASPRAVTPVGDGDRVFGLEVIATPGHTPGHISVLDPVGGLLVAGDALNGGDGGVVGPNPDFSEDMATANDSVRKLAGFTFDSVLFGHGEPVEGDADAQVAALAEQL